MRLRAAVLVAALSLLAPASAAAAPRLAGERPLASSNVEPLATLPVGHPIGARFRDNYMFVTGTEGLTVYDISDPVLPMPVGALPLPHFENEDVDLGGNTLLISNDPSEGVGILYVIDISNPTQPTIKGVLANGTIGDPGVNAILGELGLDPAPIPLETGTGHTASCVDKRCHWAYLAGTAEGITIVDLRDPAAPKVAGKFVPAITGLTTHDVQIDGKGLAWIVGADGTAAYDVTDPLHPALVARTDEAIKNSGQLGVPSLPDDPIFHFGEAIGGEGENPIDLIHHDSLRLGTVALHGNANTTRFELPNGQGFDTKHFTQQKGKTYPAGGDSPVLGIVEEDYTRPTCKGAGSFQTWGKTDQQTSTGATKFGMLDMYVTELETSWRSAAGRPPTASARRITSTTATASWPAAGTRRARASSTSATRRTSSRSATGCRRRARRGRSCSLRPTRRARSSTRSTSPAASTCSSSTALTCGRGRRRCGARGCASAVGRPGPATGGPR